MASVSAATPMTEGSSCVASDMLMPRIQQLSPTLHRAEDLPRRAFADDDHGRSPVSRRQARPRAAGKRPEDRR
jgi:hypothetical protein